MPLRGKGRDHGVSPPKVDATCFYLLIYARGGDGRGRTGTRVEEKGRAGGEPGMGAHGEGGQQPSSTSSARRTPQNDQPPSHTPRCILDPSPLPRPFILPPAQQPATPKPRANRLLPQTHGVARAGLGRPCEARAPQGPLPDPSGRAPPLGITHLRPRPRPNAEAAAGWRGRRLGSRGSHLPFPRHSSHPPRSATEQWPRSSAAQKSKGVRLRHHNQMAEPPWPAAQPAHWSLPPPLLPPLAVAQRSSAAIG